MWVSCSSETIPVGVIWCFAQMPVTGIPSIRSRAGMAGKAGSPTPP